ncbi:hypothetical protein ACV229_17020 [Burkholderia sp. MR1-5-21]
MLHCCSRRTVFTAPPAPSHQDSNAHANSAGARVATAGSTLLGLVGWYRLEQLLASIPDSNDDFGVV